MSKPKPLPAAPLVPLLPANSRDPSFWDSASGVVFPLAENMEKEDFIRRFPGFLFCFIPEVHPKDANGEPIKRRIDHSFEADNATLRSYQEQGYGVYFSVNGFNREADATGHPLPANRTTENLRFVNGHYVDIDCPKEWRKLPVHEFHLKLKQFKKESFAALTDLTHPARAILPFIPHLIVETRHGFQAVWLFDEPIDLAGASEEKKTKFFSAYTENQREIISLFGGDKQASDLVRVIRFPFSWHLKNPASPFPCVPVFWNLGAQAKGIPFKAFREALQNNLTTTADTGYTDKNGNRLHVPSGPIGIDARMAEAAGADQAIRVHMQRANPAFSKLTESEHEEVVAEIERLYPKRDRPSIRRLVSGAPDGERNNTLHIIACAYRQSGVGEEEAIASLEGYSGLSRSESRAVVKSAYKRPKEYGWNHPAIASVLTEEERNTYRAFYAEVAHAKFGKKHKGLDKIATHEENAAPTVAVAPDVVSQEAKDAVTRRRVSKAMQADAIIGYHHRMRERYPLVRYLGSLGEHRRTGNIYKPIIDKQELPHTVSRHLEDDGLGEMQTRGVADRVVFNWMSMQGVSIPDDKIEPVPPAGSDYLPVQNGLLDLSTRKLRPYPDDEAWLTISTASYDPVAGCPRWLQFIDEITVKDTKKAQLLQEIAGYAISSSVKFQKAFVFIGGGSNGKGVFTDIVGKLLGTSLCSALTLDDLQTQFGPAGLERKRLNVIDEISDNYFRSDFVKRIIGGSPLQADVKFKERRFFRPTAKLVFTVNTLPRIDDTTFAIYRRLMIVKFLQTFRGDTLDMLLPSKLEAELPGILNWCLDGYERLFAKGSFTTHEETALALEEMNESNSTLVRFLLSSACMLPENHLDVDAYRENIEVLYKAYHQYSVSMGGRSKGISAFQHELSGLTHPLLASVAIGKREPKTGIMWVTGVRLKATPLL